MMGDDDDDDMCMGEMMVSVSGEDLLLEGD